MVFILLMEKLSFSNHLRKPAFGWASFFLLTWFWAAWWMGDTFRVTRENSFFAFDTVLLHGIWQQSFGHLWIVGRALLVFFRWPVIGGLLVASLLTGGSWLVAYCLRLRPSSRWLFIAFVPAIVWMAWVAWTGLNIYYQAESGRTLGVLFLGVLVCMIDAFIIWTFKRKERNHTPSLWSYWSFLFIPFLVLPFAITHLRHPYQRPYTHMQVQLMNEDWNGVVETAHKNASLSYRPLAADYAIALVHTGHLADALFDIRLDYDSLHIRNYSGAGDFASDLYTIDCDYHAGLFRAATHKAVEHLTMMGPTLFSLKHLTRLALLDYDWDLARKYLFILKRTPFEGDFVKRFEPMVGHTELVEADPVFARLRRTEPIADSFESQYESPAFLGYTTSLMAGRTMDALTQSLMACLYSKRMPDFLLRCQPLVGTQPPRSIAEGLVTQSLKEPDILKAFPQLQMNAQIYQGFIRSNEAALRDRPANARRLFEQYKGYYPYYYFFGNLKATRKSDDTSTTGWKAGVN